MTGMLVAPPYDTVHVVTETFGMLLSHAPGEPSAPRAKLWVLAEEIPGDESHVHGRLIAYYAHPQTGAVTRADLGLIASATLTSKHWDVLTVSHGRFVVNVANCLCGAGAVGYAGPVEARHVQVRVRRDACPWLTMH
jgi:hypothetical protein